jgi:hypothetical protein
MIVLLVLQRVRLCDRCHAHTAPTPVVLCPAVLNGWKGALGHGQISEDASCDSSTPTPENQEDLEQSARQPPPRARQVESEKHRRPVTDRRLANWRLVAGQSRQWDSSCFGRHPIQANEGPWPIPGLCCAVRLWTAPSGIHDRLVRADCWSLLTRFQVRTRPIQYRVTKHPAIGMPSRTSESHDECGRIPQFTRPLGGRSATRL